MKLCNYKFIQMIIIATVLFLSKSIASANDNQKKQPTQEKQPNNNKEIIKKQINFSPSGYVSKIFGEVTVKRKNKILALKEKDKIFEGDHITVGYKSLAKLMLSGDSSIVLTPGSRFIINKHSSQEKFIQSTMRLVKGTLHFFVKPEKEIQKNIRIQAANSILGVRGTSGFVSLSTDGKVTVALLKGELTVLNERLKDKAVALREGQITYIERDRPPYPPQEYSTEQIEKMATDINTSCFSSVGNGGVEFFSSS